jgi:hypothetical protein
MLKKTSITIDQDLAKDLASRKFESVSAMMQRLLEAEAARSHRVVITVHDADFNLLKAGTPVYGTAMDVAAELIELNGRSVTTFPEREYIIKVEESLMGKDLPHNTRYIFTKKYPKIV